MSRGKATIGFLGAMLLLAGSPGYAAGEVQSEGTDWKHLAAQMRRVRQVGHESQPAPSGVSVAVLAFTGLPMLTETQAQAELPRACLLLNLQRHGFRIVPEARSPSLVPALMDKAMGLKAMELKVYRENIPLGQWSREQAVDAGKKVSADWVIYGDCLAEIDYKISDPPFPRVKKVICVRLHVVLVDVHSAEVLYWRRVEKSAQGSSIKQGFGSKAEDAEIGRGLLVQMTNMIFDDITKALRKHEVGPEVTRKDLEQLIGAMGL